MQNNTTEELTLEEAKQIIARLQQKYANKGGVQTDPRNIGHHIKRRRVKAGMSQYDIGVAGIGAIEVSGRSVRLMNLKKIANKIGCQAWEIVKDWEDANPACELASADETRTNENRPSA